MKLNGEPLNEFWFIYQIIEPWLPRPIVTHAKSEAHGIVCASEPAHTRTPNKPASQLAKQAASQPASHPASQTNKQTSHHNGQESVPYTPQIHTIPFNHFQPWLFTTRIRCVLLSLFAIAIAIAVYHNICYGAIFMFPFSAYFSSFALTFFHAQAKSIYTVVHKKQVISNTDDDDDDNNKTATERKTNEKKKKQQQKQNTTATESDTQLIQFSQNFIS